MHALHLPPHHIGRITALAALLAIVLTLAIGLATPLGGSSGPTLDDAVTSRPAATQTGVPAQPRAKAPTWVADPLANPLSTPATP